MIAGTGSGSGKTTIVCGLGQCFKDMGLNISALKCGPDYIDSMFHSRVLNMSTGNLDSWFCDNATIKYLLAGKEDKSDITIVEGVMGYYDGQGFSTKGSSYEIADITDTPVILIVNCRGMSNSIGAVVKGYLGYEKNNNIKGVIFNNLSDRLYGNAARIVKDMGIEPLGYMPYKKNAVLESRHLGLVTSAEVEHFQEKISSIAKQMRESVDIEGILRIAENASKLEAIHKSIDKKDVRIAVAKDEAFCFLYDDNIDYLRQCGCEIVYFSPLADNKLPDNIDGLLLYGGYPELHAKALSENVSMRNDIAKKIKEGLPCIAECGGFLYLHEYLETPEKDKYPMAGIIKGMGYNAGRLQRFGYMTLTAKKDTLIASTNESFRAHEFHYWNSDCPGEDYEIKKASDNSIATAGYGSDTLYAGFPHIYFYGNEQVADNFINACVRYRKNYKKYNDRLEGPDIKSFIPELGSDIKSLIPELSKIKASSKDSVQKAHSHWNGIAKPLHGLGLMEKIISQIAGIEHTADVNIDRRAVIVMCADNGIVEESVTQTGQEVTAIVSCNMADGISSVCRMAAYANADVIPVNVGIAMDTLEDGTDVGTYKGLVNKRVMSGTNNFLKEPAMSEEQLIQAIYAGITQVKECKEQRYNILATGEMGIGNTTTSTALACILLNLEPHMATGRGAGLDDKGLKKKIEVITRAKEMYGSCQDNPLTLLQNIGGLDIAGLVGVYIGCALYGIPVVIDGVISAVAALIAVRLNSQIGDYIIASHQGKEPAMKALLNELGRKAVIHGELALGEGTGAVMMFPLLDMALQVYRENTTFDDIRITAYEDYEKC